MATFGSLSVAPWILFAQMSWTTDAVPVITASQPQETRAAAEILDRGEVFGREAEQRARESLLKIYRRHRASVLVETVRSLHGVWIADVALRRSGAAGSDRLYVLVAGDERDVGVIGARRGPSSLLTDQQREAIRRAFLGPLREGRPDEAIEQGVRSIRANLDAAATRAGPGVRSAVISAMLLLTALVVILVGLRSRRGSEDRRRDDAGAVAGPYRGPSFESSPPGVVWP
jgi:uncharacterized membrane protein YgcG